MLICPSRTRSAAWGQQSQSCKGFRRMNEMTAICSIGCVAKMGGSQGEAVALRRSGGCCEMVVEHDHVLRQRRGPNAKSSLHKAHLAPDAGLQAPGASLSFAQGSHDFESLVRGIGRGDRFETAHRLDQYLELSVIGLDHVIEILKLPVGRLPVQFYFARSEERRVGKECSRQCRSRW